MLNRFLFFCIIICLLTFIRINAQSKKISGYIKDRKTNEYIQFATIYEVNNKKGITSDINGYFELNLKKYDSLIIEVSHLNYDKLTTNFIILHDTTVTFYMQEKNIELNEVVVSSSYRIKDENTSFTRINHIQLNNLPSLGGEKDILKALQLSPGVQGGIEGTSGLIVRGGEPGQNLYLIDNLPIYSPSHLYGFFSTFNSDIIYSADLIRAGLPSNYGGKLSSVVDIKTKKPKYNDANGLFSLGLVSSKLYAEIPVLKEKSSLLLSFRRSYFDILIKLKARYDMDNERNKIGFYDTYIKYEHSLNKKNIFSFNFLRSVDKFYYIFNDPEGITNSEDISGVNWINNAFFFNYKYLTEAGNNLSLFSSLYTYEYNYINESYISGTIDNAFKKSTSITDFTFKIESEAKIKDNIRLIYGGSFIDHNLYPIEISSLNKTINRLYENSKEITIFLHSYFTLDEYNTLSLGIRQNGYFFNNSSFFPIEPRISIINNLNNYWKIKSSFSRNIQFIHRIENFSAGMPVETWHISNDEMKFENGYQISTEVYHKIEKFKLEIGISPYYKWMDGLVEYGNFYSDFPLPSSLQNNVYEINGTGRSFGIEIYSNKKIGNLNYSASYILSKSIRKFEEINYNTWYPSNFDRRHYFNFNTFYNLKEKYLFSINWIFASGQPVTLPDGLYFLNTEEQNSDIIAYYVSSKNNYRLKPYHRLDISIQQKKIKRNGYRIWELSIYNVYNRANPFNVDIEDEIIYENETFIRTERKLKQYSLFPFIPSISYIRKFN